MKFQPPKFLLVTAAATVPFVLFFGMLRYMEASAKPRSLAQIAFRSERPSADDVSRPERNGQPSAGWSSDWLEERYDELMTWERNPWKKHATRGFGDHYFELLNSKDPADQMKAKELLRLAEELYKKVLERYPELAVEMREVAPERNGFLKWLELSERFDADPNRPGHHGAKHLGIPQPLLDSLNGTAAWDASATKAWLASEKALLDEIRSIGLLPEQSVNGIDIDRWFFISARFGKSCTDALMLEARIAAEEGNTAAALESVSAARGFADHFGKVETPTLLAVTVQILIEMQVRNQVISHIIPALPPGQFDPQVWENAANPAATPPAEFARIMKGEWNVTARKFLMPMLSDFEDPRYPRDPDQLIDAHAGMFVSVLNTHSGQSPADWAKNPEIKVPDLGYLSRSSRQLTDTLMVGSRAWSKGFIRAQSQAGMTQAAFALMKGQALPNDPIHGLPYVWDPATRQLSLPADPLFKEVSLDPIIVPKP